MFRSGDIVIRRWSKARTLKGKVCKVISTLPSDSYRVKYRVINAYGKQKDLYEWSIKLLADEINSADSDIEVALGNVVKARQKAYDLRKEEKEVSKFFPVI